MSEFVRLGNHITLQKGKPPLVIDYAGQGALPYLNPEYLRGRAHAQLAKPGSDAVCVDESDTVLLWDGSNAGEFFKAKPGLVASTMAKVTPGKSFDPEYFFHAAKQAEGYLKAKTNGTGIPHVDRELLELILAFCPSPIEQRKIAQILDGLDIAIIETEAIIAKLSAVKQGLLHDLLTRGIDGNGELRPPQVEAPHLYKESLLGGIPKEWEVKQITDLLADVDPAMRSGPFGSALLKAELVEAGVPLLGIDNVHAERFVADYSRFVTPKKFVELARYAVRPADLMITIMGTVGRCCLVPEAIGQALSSKHTWTITLDQDNYSPYLAMLQINYAPWVLQHFARDQQGGTMAAIRSETLRSTMLPRPPREEQRLMEARLREISKRIHLEVNALAKMRAEKSGLMDDLLTGRVRVTRLLIEGEQQEGDV
ncbi:restriction endonuclease subunit S [Burkholderia pseudomallei]|uniref:restriction endonuclease subunit S n=1 Tax=Burkholderia pseudomallei TaxID=28450 RepID=UPI000F08D182|nr:restriction endonuclease subunit S [Burkholderia pseudomallei]VCG63119.1 restriction endonuclease S subunits [Burkholderia pseudomallei]VCH00414.1 restriction endonuclease S subunits [Burkholderia pseudomallei]VCS98634.1 restriction endonuclease S subunits [Burkholderia pseudomallei]